MNKHILCSILLSFSLLGCTDFLDKKDPTATTFEEFYNDEGDLRRVTFSSFYDIWGRTGDRPLMFYMEEGKSDNAYSRAEGHNHQVIANGNFNSNTSLFLFYYQEYMKHLGRLNTFIDQIDVPYVESEDIRQKYKGAMEGLRVWHYFRLTARWGAVPFHLMPADLTTALQPVTPKNEILDELFPLAEKIANGLSKEEYSTDKWMFNQYSLKAITMRYALYDGRYELAARLAREIIDSGKYSLHPIYGDLFQYKATSNNNETIQWLDRAGTGNNNTFSFVDLGPHYRTGNGQSFLVPLKSLVDSYWTLQGRPIDECPIHSKREYELNPKLNRDPRYKVSIFGHGDIFYDEKVDVFNENSPMYYENERASKSGYWFKKYVDEADAFRNGDMEFSLLRYAEVLLTYAESKIMLNQVDDLTKDCINKIRKRAGLDMSFADVTLPAYDSYTQKQWIKLIRNERRIELAGEGLRYDDILRWQIAEDVLNQPALGYTREIDGKMESLKIEDRSFKPHNYLWPFHESSLRIEPGLKQNPGY